MVRRSKVIVLAFFCCILVSQCVGSRQALASITGGYSYSDASGLIYLHLMQTGSQLTGYMEIVTADEASATGYTAKRVDNIVGTISNASISLRVNQLLGLSSTFTDIAVHSGYLVMEMPSQGGSITQFRMLTTSVGRWNKMVAKFEDRRKVHANRVSLHNTIANQLTGANRDWEDATNEQSSDQSELESAKAALISAQTSLEKAKVRQSKAQDALAKAKETAADKHKLADETKTGDDLYAASSADYDVSSAEYDVNSATQDVTSAQHDVNNESDSINKDQAEIDNCKERMSTDATEIELLHPLSDRPIDSLVPSEIKITSGRLIFDKPDINGKCLYVLQPNSKVTGFPLARGWSLVLMTDNSLAWMAPKDSVKLEGNLSTVGQLAIVTAASAPIRNSPDQNARVLSICQRNQAIAVRGEEGTQYKVVMIDGSIGYVNKADVRLLDFQVLSTSVNQATHNSGTNP
jgi:hypothetical protein